MHALMPIPEKFRDLPLPPPSRGYDWLPFTPFLLLHVAVFGALWTGTSWVDWVACAVLYFVRMFAVTGAYHRYFSHRTYKTSRWFQFVLAFLAQTSSQKGALWWASAPPRPPQVQRPAVGRALTDPEGLLVLARAVAGRPGHRVTDYKQDQGLRQVSGAGVAQQVLAGAAGGPRRGHVVAARAGRACSSASS
jgi:hypothetical protein